MIQELQQLIIPFVLSIVSIFIAKISQELFVKTAVCLKETKEVSIPASIAATSISTHLGKPDCTLQFFFLTTPCGCRGSSPYGACSTLSDFLTDFNVKLLIFYIKNNLK